MAASCLQAGEPMILKSVNGSRTIPLADLSHEPWSVLLQAFVDEEGLVDYEGWKANPMALASLREYLSALGSIELNQNASREEKLAYWINAYNAVTVFGILREYPTTSIRNHTPKLWGYHIWKDLKLRVSGIDYSLDNIEHDVLRKMEEPRIHFAIVCASMGCPKLRDKAYTPDMIEQQLHENAVDFFSRKENLRFDSQRRQIMLSSILDWFASDFGDSPAEILESIRPFLSNEIQTQLNSGSYQIKYLDYDWSLNEQ